METEIKWYVGYRAKNGWILFFNSSQKNWEVHRFRGTPYMDKKSAEIAITKLYPDYMPENACVVKATITVDFEELK